MIDLLSQTPEELTELFKEWGQPAYRAGQVFKALHSGVPDAASMTTLPLKLREKLDFPRPRVKTEQLSADGTRKLLYELSDGETVESVLLDYGGETTVCLSSQVGCRMGCAFCASTTGGKVRDLTAGEMLGQILYCGRHVSRAVMMGIGEPLDNLDNTARFLRLLSRPEGRGMSLRHVSLSTCGLAPEILKLADMGLPVTLSVSLHAPDDDTRNYLMPINRRFSLQELLTSCRMYFEKTRRRNSFEYILIKGINDSPAQAGDLAALLKGQDAHVNLIFFNPVKGKDFLPSSRETAERFAQTLASRGVGVTVRRRLGADIDAACGQLRRRTAETKAR
ncbi:MAG: 23S rRNA (adenine(2503)-C(2))-methyltransferase RlmN [Oscillospiraceae bacterium]|jgi:23S rRNA (adenine2503-C2)-methyltransferase|nr:23S rRNA (adenine(2503)-C(2))-methyltransferase RlmN [Oscillospiraceae bacterium]